MARTRTVLVHGATGLPQDLLSRLTEYGWLAADERDIVVQISDSVRSDDARQESAAIVEALADRADHPRISALDYGGAVMDGGGVDAKTAFAFTVRVWSPCVPGGIEIPRSWFGSQTLITIGELHARPDIRYSGALYAGMHPLDVMHPDLAIATLIAEAYRLYAPDVALLRVCGTLGGGGASAVWVASNDPAAIDCAVAMRLGLSPHRVPHLREVTKNILLPRVQIDGQIPTSLSVAKDPSARRWDIARRKVGTIMHVVRARAQFIRKNATKVPHALRRRAAVYFRRLAGR